MSASSDKSAQERAWDSVVLQARARGLIQSWRDRARVLDPLHPEQGRAWTAAAAELERSLDIPEPHQVLQRFLLGLRKEIAHEVRSELSRMLSLRSISGSLSPSSETGSTHDPART